MIDFTSLTGIDHLTRAEKIGKALGFIDTCDFDTPVGAARSLLIDVLWEAKIAHEKLSHFEEMQMVSQQQIAASEVE